MYGASTMYNFFMQLVNVYINTETKLYVSILNIKGVMTITPGGRTKGAARKERVKSSDLSKIDHILLSLNII